MGLFHQSFEQALHSAHEAVYDFSMPPEEFGRRMAHLIGLCATAAHERRSRGTVAAPVAVSEFDSAEYARYSDQVRAFQQLVRGSEAAGEPDPQREEGGA